MAENTEEKNTEEGLKKRTSKEKVDKEEIDDKEEVKHIKKEVTTEEVTKTEEIKMAKDDAGKSIEMAKDDAGKSIEIEKPGEVTSPLTEKTEEHKEELEKPETKKKTVEMPKKMIKKEKPVEKIKNVRTKRKLEGEEKRLFKIAHHIRAKKPKFLRQQYGMVKRLDEVWRKPKGVDSKLMVEKRGQGHLVKVGYKKPESIRGIHPSGYWTVAINNLKELKNINKNIQAAVISSQVGRKKRNEIIKKANELNIIILNPRKGEI